MIDFFHLLLQGFLLRLPKLSEMRLASSKTLAFLRAWHYIARAEIKGDYLEFGVFRGYGFRLSLQAAAKFGLRGGRFFAFDSFEGLPAPDSARDAVFKEGEYSAGRSLFESNIRSAVNGREVIIVPGYFDHSLTAQLREKHNMRAVAFVNIDCDLYGGSLDALRFCTPLLQTGTILYFDDWFFSGGDMSLGEPGACAEWLRENPKITLVDYGIVGIMGKMFIVQVS